MQQNRLLALGAQYELEVPRCACFAVTRSSCRSHLGSEDGFSEPTVSQLKLIVLLDGVQVHLYGNGAFGRVVGAVGCNFI